LPGQKACLHDAIATEGLSSKPRRKVAWQSGIRKWQWDLSEREQVYMPLQVQNQQQNAGIDRIIPKVAIFPLIA